MLYSATLRKAFKSFVEETVHMVDRMGERKKRNENKRSGREIVEQIILITQYSNQLSTLFRNRNPIYT